MNKEENKQHALENGYSLICDGKYPFELEREWNSILNIVPKAYRVVWQNTPVIDDVFKIQEDDSK